MIETDYITMEELHLENLLERKRELKPNYARQFGPVEVWDVRDVPFRYHRDGDLVLHGTKFSHGEHDQCHDMRFWSVRPAKEDL